MEYIMQLNDEQTDAGNNLGYWVDNEDFFGVKIPSNISNVLPTEL